MSSTSSDLFVETRSTDGGLMTWLKGVSTTAEEFRSTHLHLHIICNGFLHVVRNARDRGVLPHPVATAVACDLYRKFVRMHPYVNRFGETNRGTSRDVFATQRDVDAICENLFGLVYDDEHDDADRDDDSGKTDPFLFLKRKPYYEIVEELRERIEEFAAEYETFQVEFDEVKEMIQRSHRVIGHALSRWETFFRSVSFHQWRYTVRFSRSLVDVRVCLLLTTRPSALVVVDLDRVASTSSTDSRVLQRTIGSRVRRTRQGSVLSSVGELHDRS